MAAAATYKAKLTYPQVFLWRMGLFVILAILLAIILDGQTQQLRTSFLANPGLNGLILGVLFIGIVYAFRQVLRLYPEIRWVNSFRISDPGIPSTRHRHCSRRWRPCCATAPDICRLPPAPCARCSIGRLPPRRAARDHALSRRPARVPRPARHLLGPASDRDLGRHHHQRARHQRQRKRDAVRSVEGRPRRAAQRHGHRLLLLDVRPWRLADLGFPRSSGRPRAKPLLQRARRLALRHHRAAIGGKHDRHRPACRHSSASPCSTCSARCRT